jgi:hypothetical protein
VAERELLILRQTKSASNYTARFQQMSTRLQLSEGDLVLRYYGGLKDEIKDELVRMDRPTSLTKMIEEAIKIDNRLHKRRAEKKGNAPITSTKTPTSGYKHRPRNYIPEPMVL